VCRSSSALAIAADALHSNNTSLQAVHLRHFPEEQATSNGPTINASESSTCEVVRRHSQVLQKRCDRHLHLTVHVETELPQILLFQLDRSSDGSALHLCYCRFPTKCSRTLVRDTTVQM
jgi:hypothetical protein